MSKHISEPLNVGPYLAFVTQATKAPTPGQSVVGSIYHLRRVEFLLIQQTQSRPIQMDEDLVQEEAHLLSLLTRGLESNALYFSFEFDLTHTCQRVAAFERTESRAMIAERADRRFCWNYPALECFFQSLGECWW